jgi:hypothetical protein
MTTLDATATRKQFKLWFFRDLSDDQRLNLFRLMMPVIPGRELETHAAQGAGLGFCLDALSSLPEQAVTEEPTGWYVVAADSVGYLFGDKEQAERHGVPQPLYLRRPSGDGVQAGRAEVIEATGNG